MKLRTGPGSDRGPRLLRGIALLCAVAASGCSIFFEKPSYYEKGPIYCAERYRIGAKGTVRAPFDKKQVWLAHRGYPYVLAAAKSLHIPKELESEEHRFGESSRLKALNGYEDYSDGSGLQAQAYEVLAPDERTLENVVVAIRGSETREFFKDWVLQDFSYQIQNDNARALVRRIWQEQQAKGRLPGGRLVIAGYSLGGGLAAHLSRHEETRDIVGDIWLLNPSPRDGLWGTEPRPNNYLLYQKREILFNLRDRANRWFDDELAFPPNTAAYDRIKAHPVVSHFRWGLTLQVLHAADAAHWCKTRGSDPSSDALRILGSSYVESCANGQAKAAAARHAREAQEEALQRGTGMFDVCPSNEQLEAATWLGD